LRGTVFDLAEVEKKISSLEKKTREPDFWKNHKAAVDLITRLNELKEEFVFWSTLEKRLLDAKNPDEIRTLEKEFRRGETRTLFKGRYDKNSAILSVYAGAGGRDAEDWAEMLFKMYEKYAARKKWDASLLHKHEGAEGGVNNASMEIDGAYAYGFLKKENGVHRLVRISPFSAAQLRHTSFAFVEITPRFSPASTRLGEAGEADEKEIELKEEDLRVDTYRSSGPGGQNVNKRETAVRVTHIPTGLSAAVQSERSQAQNKIKALSLLRSKIAKLLEEHKVKELKELKGEKVKIEWGRQIRSYVLHPYQLVKDHRTEYETARTKDVLEGDLDEFIESELRIKN